ncbi:MAG: response regulator transcription factor [Acidobacteria bacterium]|nr:response regulator transcription factor [Acidobacteriota bacterium]
MVKIRVRIITRDKFRYLGLRSTLTKNDSFVVVEKNDLPDETQIVAQFMPDVVVFDISTVQIELPMFVRTCKQVSPHTKLLVIGANDNAEVVTRALRAGAKGYLNILCFPDEIISATKAVHGGNAWIPRRAMSEFIDEIASEMNLKAQVHGKTGVTRTQKKVLELLARQGLTNKEIAGQLGIEARTVEFHITSLLRKFNLSNRNQLVIHAIRKNLVSVK